MEGKRFLRAIRLKNLLSYGSEGLKLDLEPLNVLIGPNAAGKSNLIEAISLLAATPRDLLQPIRRGGGILEWLWKGAVDPRAELDVDLDVKGLPLRYRLSFTASEASFHLVREELILKKPERLLYSFREGSPEEVPTPINREQSIFSLLKDPVGHPELTETGRLLGQIRLFRGFESGIGATLALDESRYGVLVGEEEVDTPAICTGAGIRDWHLPLEEEPSARVLGIDLIARKEVGISFEDALQFPVFVLAANP